MLTKLRHLENRKSRIARPYFRDWSNMRFHEGKTFLAPPRPFRRDVSLYFPNLQGRTLLKGSVADATRDTTPVLRGRVSVVSVFSGVWAERQAASFASAAENPALEAALASSASAAGIRAQRVWINVEEHAFKNLLIRLFMGGLRKRIAREEAASTPTPTPTPSSSSGSAAAQQEDAWSRYFVVRRGVSDEIREALGYLNSKVGYTYLLDGECRVRWAGSGSSDEGEREGLARAVVRLLDEEAKVRDRGAEKNKKVEGEGEGEVKGAAKAG